MARRLEAWSRMAVSDDDVPHLAFRDQHRRGNHVISELEAIPRLCCDDRPGSEARLNVQRDGGAGGTASERATPVVASLIVFQGCMPLSIYFSGIGCGGLV